MVPLFKSVEERSTAENYHAVSLLSVVSKVFKKLVNNRGIIQKKYGHISFSQNKNRCFKGTKNGSWRSWERCRPPSGGQRAKPSKSLDFFV